MKLEGKKLWNQVGLMVRVNGRLQPRKLFTDGGEISSNRGALPPSHGRDRMSSHEQEPPVWIKGLAVLGALSLVWTVGKGLWDRFFKRL